VYCRALADTDISAWVNAMDVFDDLLLNALYTHDSSLGKYTLGQIGSVLHGGRLTEDCIGKETCNGPRIPTASQPWALALFHSLCKVQ
jgi:hypothetical protein